MADIFLSYATGDRQRVHPIVDALEEAGWSVWWDRELVSGPSFDDSIEQELAAASCVIVVWTERAITSTWVRAEANEGLERGILVPVRLDDVRPPLPFRIAQTADLSNWPHDRSGFDSLTRGLTRILGVPSTTDDEKPFVAVLPFVNTPPDPEHEYFADGLTEDLIHRLARIKRLKVLARASCFKFKGQSEDARDIARSLGVTHLVEGSVRRAGDRVRVTAQLVRGRDGAHEWSERFDRKLDDVFELQDDLTSAVAVQLADVLVRRENPYQPKHEAYDEYLRGRSCLRHYTLKSSADALSYFESSSTIDPGFAAAYVGAAEAALKLRTYTIGQPLELLDRAARHSAAALDLDPSSTSAAAVQADIDARRDFELQRALDRLRPIPKTEIAEYITSVCVVLAFAGRFDVMEEVTQEVMQVDPLNMDCQFWLGGAVIGQGRYEEGQRLFERLISLEPDHGIRPFVEISACLLQDRLDDALAIVESYPLDRREFTVTTNKAQVYARLGMVDQLRSFATRTEQLDGPSVGTTHAYAMLGDMDGVLRNLAGAIQRHDQVLWHMTGQRVLFYVDVNGNPLVDVYASESVQKLLGQYGLNWETVDALVL